MESILALLLEVQRLQLQLQNLQQSRSARTEIRHARPVVSPVKPVTTTLPTVTATPQPAPATTAPSSTSDFRSQVEAYVLEETNAARAQSGLGALSTDSAAASVARMHSADMLANNYFAHNNLSGCSAGCRLTNAGYAWRSYGENIHWMSGYNLSARATAQKIVNDWMNSPPHRANILGSFNFAGTGIAISGTKIYATAVYTTR